MFIFESIFQMDKGQERREVGEKAAGRLIAFSI